LHRRGAAQQLGARRAFQGSVVANLNAFDLARRQNMHTSSELLAAFAWRMAFSLPAASAKSRGMSNFCASIAVAIRITGPALRAA
jgi:hypothetical protein